MFSGYGSTASTFGSPGLGSNRGSVFGRLGQPQQPSLFGGSTFGSQQSGLRALGSGAVTSTSVAPTFGAQTQGSSLFGQQARPTTSIFSSTSSGISPMSTQSQAAGTSIQFRAITGTDSNMMNNGAIKQINTRTQYITAMKQYEDKSIEELRFEDYQLNRKGPGSSMIGGAGTAQQPQTSFFSGMGGTSTGTLGQSTAFGQTGASGGGFFGSLNQTKTGGLFGTSTTSTSTGFGGGLGLSSQPQTSLFGTTTTSTSGQPQTSVFATTTSNTGLGGTSPFTFSTQPQQQQGLSLFGTKSLSTPASTATTFGGFGGTATNNKPLFGGAMATPAFGAGSTAPAFGTGSLFSTNNQQQKPFSTAFGSTTQPSTFGTTTTSSFRFSNPVSTPAVTFGGASAPAPAFGTGNTGTGTFGTQSNFPLSSTRQITQPTGFSTNLFSNTNSSGATGGTGTGFFSNPAAPSTFGGFGSNQLQLGQPQTFALQSQQQQQALQYQHQMRQSIEPNAISFATTPFKDCHLFYNRISSQKDLPKLTPPLAQRQYTETSRRKTSPHLTVPPSTRRGSSSLSGNPTEIMKWPTVKNLTYSTFKTNSITKFDIFDEFPEDGFGSRVDHLFSSRSNVKKLVLKSVDNSSYLTTGSQSAPTLNGSAGYAVRAARRSSISGLSLRKSSYLSPLSRQRRIRIAMSELANNQEISYSGDGERTGSDSVIRRLEFSSESQHELNEDKPDESAGAELIPSTAGGESLTTQDSGVELSEAVNVGEGRTCGVICTRHGYYIKPGIEELNKHVDSTGACYVRGFEVGRVNFGRIRYLQPVNVANINIDEIVSFRHKEVVVYPDDENKPELGMGLNAPAEIELERVFPIEKQTKELIRSTDKIKAQNYKEKLKKACERTGAEFISYNETLGVWRFRVAHFSKYGIEEEEEDEEEKKGLGGIAQKDLKQQSKKPQGQKSPGTAGASSMAGAVGAGDAPGPIHARLSLSHYIPSPPAPPIRRPLLEIGPPTSDVELNPLTPFDSDDEEDDSNDEEEEELDGGLLSLSKLRELGKRQSLGSADISLSKYRPILKEYGAEKTRLMKSVMSIDEFDQDPTHLTHAIKDQPPSKKSRPSTKILMPESEGQMLKERLEQSEIEPSPPPSIVPREKVLFNDDDVEDLFSSIAPKTFTSGIRLSGAPRVCFLPGGQFIKIVQGIKPEGFKAEIKTEKIISYADKEELAPSSKSVRRALEKQMEERLNGDGVLFQKHARILKEEMAECKIAGVSRLLEEELVIWELCDILWPEEKIKLDDGAQLEQRKRLSKWLERYARILFGDEYPTDKTTLGLLKKGQMEEACNLAIEEGNDWLAMLMCTDPHLLLDFADESVVEGMGADYPDIFALISGNMGKLSFLTKESVLNMSSAGWLQFFALYIWFEGVASCQLPISVEEAVGRFEAFMRSVGESEDLALPAKETSSVGNLAMNLLKLYSFTGYPVNVVVTPRTGSKDCLDYKLSWLLMRDLEEIGYLTSDDCYKGVCLGFAGMLEGIGMWKWAPFVLNHLPRAQEEIDSKGEAGAMKLARDVVIQRLLERNLTEDMEEQIEDFLVKNLAIPTNLLYSIRMWRNQSLRVERVDEAIFYLGDMGEWQKSFDLLRSFLASKSSLDLIGNRMGEQAKNMRIHLKRLEQKKKEITGWEVEGQMLSSYLALKDPTGTETAVLAFLESMMKFKPANINQAAFLLDMTLNAQKVIQLLLQQSDVSISVKMKIEDNLIMFLDTAKPDEYFEGLRSFINFNIAPKSELYSFHNWESQDRVSQHYSRLRLVPPNHHQSMEMDVQPEQNVIGLSGDEQEEQSKNMF